MARNSLGLGVVWFESGTSGGTVGVVWFGDALLALALVGECVEIGLLGATAGAAATPCDIGCFVQHESVSVAVIVSTRASESLIIGLVYINCDPTGRLDAQRGCHYSRGAPVILQNYETRTLVSGGYGNVNVTGLATL